MNQICKEFSKILDDTNSNENDCQEFIENNPYLMIQNFLLNHQLHFNSFITKFPLDTALISDFAYLTKSSAKWRIVFVELENQHKKLFRKDNRKQITPTAEFTNAISQIDTWKDFINRNENETLRRLAPIRTPMPGNRCEFKFVLIIGRDSQLRNSQGMRDRLATFERDDLAIHTYDYLLRYFRENGQRKYPPNIITLSKNKFTFKMLHSRPDSLFSFVRPEDFYLSKEHKQKLLADGYDIESWENGEMLIVNGKKVLKSFSAKSGTK